jgi:hypothetical protein
MQKTKEKQPAFWRFPDQKIPHPNLESIPPWIKEHGLKLMGYVATMLVAATYAIGRSRILGQYDAAGMSQLMSTWSVQDVFIQGFMDSNAWSAAFTSVLLALCVAAVVALIVGILIFQKQKLSNKFFPKIFPSAKPESPLGILIGIFTITAAFGLYFAVSSTLISQPYREGAAAFRNMHLAATGRLPPISLDVKSRAPADLVAAQAHGQKLLAARSYVLLEIPRAGTTSDWECGWLLEQAPGSIYLLTSSGLSQRSIGSLGAQWHSATPGMCSAPTGANGQAAKAPTTSNANGKGPGPLANP